MTLLNQQLSNCIHCVYNILFSIIDIAQVKYEHYFSMFYVSIFCTICMSYFSIINAQPLYLLLLKSSFDLDEVTSGNYCITWLNNGEATFVS